VYRKNSEKMSTKYTPVL